MACNYPITGYQCSDGSVVFDDRKGDVVRVLRLPCGACFGCKQDRARQWAVRCVHEASLHEHNCVITLTYNDAHLPLYGDLLYDDFQRFMKRLRKKFRGIKIRFFMCGEYGDDRRRPHFHACLFGVNFDDRIYFKTSASGTRLCTSKVLDALWSDRGGNSIGHSLIGELDFASASYISRYITEKQLGKGNEEKVLDLETGELYERTPEFVRMSLKPGIGKGFYDRWRSDMFPRDVCVINGAEMKPPQYYYRKLKEEDPEMHEEIAWIRAKRALAKSADNTPERLEVKELVLKARNGFLKRELT